MEKPNKQYTKRMFAFLDILGFSQIISESKKEPSLVGTISEIISNAKQIASSMLKVRPTILKVDPNQYSYQLFSDTSILVGNYSSHDDFLFLVTWVMIYQNIMWKEQALFIRGSIVHGDIYQDKDVLFGPALIDAYHLENDEGKASWPRVIVDSSILGLIDKSDLKRDYYEFLIKDVNNTVYLNYLGAAFSNQVYKPDIQMTNTKTNKALTPIDVLLEHKKAILLQSKFVQNTFEEAEKERILVKYQNLSEYHNRIVNKLSKIAQKLSTNSEQVNKILDDFDETVKAEQQNTNYFSKYRAQDHPEKTDLLMILSYAVRNVLRYLNETTLSSKLSAFIPNNENNILDLSFIEIIHFREMYIKQNMRKLIYDELLKLYANLKECLIDTQHLYK